HHARAAREHAHRRIAVAFGKKASFLPRRKRCQIRRGVLVLERHRGGGQGRARIPTFSGRIESNPAAVVMGGAMRDNTRLRAGVLSESGSAGTTTSRVV